MKGTSMLPFYKNGDLAIVVQQTFEQIHKGDIIVFKLQEEYLAHRLIKKNIKNCTLQTKGDACKQYDCPIAFDEIMGKVVSFERDGKIKSMNTFLRIIQNKIMSNFPCCTHYLVGILKTIS